MFLLCVGGSIPFAVRRRLLLRNLGVVADAPFGSFAYGVQIYALFFNKTIGFVLFLSRKGAYFAVSSDERLVRW